MTSHEHGLGPSTLWDAGQFRQVQALEHELSGR
jgi:hypothetical protein